LILSCSTARGSPSAAASLNPRTFRDLCTKRLDRFGSDLGPETYGAEAHAATAGVSPERDRAELALLSAALARDLPVLAICRGSQILNVARGGDLEQHLPDVVGDDKHKQNPGEFTDHDVELEPSTRVGRLLGERAPVKSHHHQGYGRLGDGLVPAACADDGTIEAIEDPSRRFALGVLWHPEAGDDLTLFEELVREAAEFRAGRSRPGSEAAAPAAGA
jgi:gamma-glutamyl-gamma-aminobutyrate hydrolase PuuD